MYHGCRVLKLDYHQTRITLYCKRGRTPRRRPMPMGRLRSNLEPTTLDIPFAHLLELQNLLAIFRRLI